MLPAVFFTVALVVFPTIFGFYIAFTSWNLSSAAGRVFNGLDNIRQLWSDPFYWNALGNMVYYSLMVLVEYAIAFGLALLLNSEIRARRFFRIVFLLPFMLSPVAVSWMVGKSIMEYRFGPWRGWRAFSAGTGRPSSAIPGSPGCRIEMMDAWVFIPLMVILLLAGFQALPKEILEAAKVDGASGWQTFWQMIFPLMLPVSITTIIIRIIFKLKLADIVINVTSGGPGRRDRHGLELHLPRIPGSIECRLRNALAEFYLIAIIIFITCFWSLKAGRQTYRRPARGRGDLGGRRGDLCIRARKRSCSTTRRRARHSSSTRVLIYGVLIFWAFVCLFPIYWIHDLVQGSAQRDAGPPRAISRLHAGVEGLAIARLSPDTIFETSTVRDEFLKRFTNSLIASSAGRSWRWPWVRSPATASPAFPIASDQ